MGDYHSARKVAMTTVSLKLSDDLAARLDALAARRGVSRSQVMREALEALVHGRKRGAVVADLAADLMGRFEGPGDLSSNPEHLEGFGR
jgi:predicted transcriptional regulator